jgi:hypothetical protein
MRKRHSTTEQNRMQSTKLKVGKFTEMRVLEVVQAEVVICWMKGKMRMSFSRWAHVSPRTSALRY